MDLIKKNNKLYCSHCGKMITEVEHLAGQCNECDPFEDEEMMEEVYGEPIYIDLDED